MALLSRFFGRTASEGAAFALGLATGPVLSPAVEEVKNEAWRTHPSRTLGPNDAAEIVAEDVERRDWGASESSAHGVDGSRFDALVGAVLNAPGMGELIQARRRNLISEGRFRHGLRKARLENLWDDALIGLLDVLLSPADLAMARQQGFVNEARQKAESELQGVDNERAEIMFELSGLPPGVDVAQRAANRDFIDRDTFDQIVREGHTKTKYTDLLWRMRNPLLTAAIGVRLYLKGWWTKAQRDELGALWGYTPQQMEDWYLSQGRPAAPGQMATAAARGINGPDGRPMDEAQFLKGIKESDIRPEWGPMLWDSRFLYPPLFQLSRLVQGGAITPDTAADWAKNARYPPEVVSALHAFWSKPTAATADSHVGKAQTQLWNATHSSYINREASPTMARNKLAQAGVAATAISAIIGLWDAERELIRKGLTPANIKKAYNKGGRNALTGQPWTRDEALAALINMGWNVTEANDYLDIP